MIAGALLPLSTSLHGAPLPTRTNGSHVAAPTSAALPLHVARAAIAIKASTRARVAARTRVLVVLTVRLRVRMGAYASARARGMPKPLLIPPPIPPSW